MSLTKEPFFMHELQSIQQNVSSVLDANIYSSQLALEKAEWSPLPPKLRKLVTQPYMIEWILTQASMHIHTVPTAAPVKAIAHSYRRALILAHVSRHLWTVPTADPVKGTCSAAIQTRTHAGPGKHARIHRPHCCPN
jgi:hypothetical protein